MACLASYNNGILHGAWIDADQDADGIWAEIAAMLKASPITEAGEFAIHDHEGFEGAQVCGYSGIDEVAELATFIAEHGSLGGALLGYYNDINDAPTATANLARLRTSLSSSRVARKYNSVSSH